MACFFCISHGQICRPNLEDAKDLDSVLDALCDAFHTENAEAFASVQASKRPALQEIANRAFKAIKEHPALVKTDNAPPSSLISSPVHRARVAFESAMADLRSRSKLSVDDVLLDQEPSCRATVLCELDQVEAMLRHIDTIFAVKAVNNGFQAAEAPVQNEPPCLALDLRFKQESCWSAQIIVHVRPFRELMNAMRNALQPASSHCPVCRLPQHFVPFAELKDVEDLDTHIKTAVWRDRKIWYHQTVCKPTTAKALPYFKNMGHKAHLQHPNIRGVLGIVADTQLGHIEEKPGTDLRQFLSSSRPDTAHCLNIASEVCEGLAFLHEHRLAHEHLTAADIWCTGGVAQIGGWLATPTELCSQIGDDDMREWRAPDKKQDTAAANVYGFGCLLIELFEEKHDAVWAPLSEADVKTRVRAGEKPPQLATLQKHNKPVHDLAFRCLAANPDERPSMTDIRGSLRELFDAPASA